VGRVVIVVEILTTMPEKRLTSGMRWGVVGSCEDVLWALAGEGQRVLSPLALAKLKLS
jgi:hypothetical protein